MEFEKETPTEEDLKFATNDLLAGMHDRWRDGGTAATILANALGAIIAAFDYHTQADFEARFDAYTAAARLVMHDNLAKRDLL